MLTQICYNVRMTVRSTGVIIWCFAFPLIMATIFMTMFAGMQSNQGAHTIALGVVEDTGWQRADGMRTMLESLTRTDAGANEIPLLALTGYEDRAAAETGVLAGEVDAALVVDADGKARLLVSPSDAGSTDQAIVQTVLDRYLQGEELAGILAAQNPEALADPAARAALAQNLSGDDASTAELSVLREPPSELSRFYYALLGYSCIMCSTIAQTLIDRTRIAATPEGSRRQVGALSPARQLAAALVASWLVVMASMMLAVAYYYVVGGISFGGRLWLTPVACGACALVSCALGAFLGSLPGVRPDAKDALITIATLALSLPAGLFGTPALDVANWLSQHAPLVQLLNPAVQTTEAMLSLTFYDSLAPFASACGTLLFIAAILGAGALLFMRRQRYACA
ncbi:ABC transporter permease [Collinsella intestinalis]|uniref:ABC transporter permease n=1 Tax=Collinsella intestinalis TaxID=147207 RepID=UPI0019571987|nr:ABC transporter permease [Collinsella intestinalis]MBM6943200.1 ABC transporter permease [Collinsella intestinalis]